MPSERELDRLARVLSFLWPQSWLQTTRGVVLCIILTAGLLGAAAGAVFGVILGAVWLAVH